MTDTSLDVSLTYTPAEDLYGVVHKSLRMAFSRLLVKLGSADPADHWQCRALVSDLEGTLRLVESHLAHEEDFIHAAIEQRAPGGVVALERDHGEHAELIAELRQLSALLVAAPPARRTGLMRRLYLRFSVFVAENFRHMEQEEQVTQRLLDELFTTAEQQEIHGRLVASVDPESMLRFVQIMVPAANPDERYALLAGGQATLPPEAFSHVLAAVKPTLPEVEWESLAARLGAVA